MRFGIDQNANAPEPVRHPPSENEDGFQQEQADSATLRIIGHRQTSQPEYGKRVTW